MERLVRVLWNGRLHVGFHTGPTVSICLASNCVPVSHHHIVIAVWLLTWDATRRAYLAVWDCHGDEGTAAA